MSRHYAAAPLDVPVTVHILRGGIALCGFENNAVPLDWPPRHYWLSTHDVAVESRVTCVGCERARKLEQAKRKQKSGGAQP